MERTGNRTWNNSPWRPELLAAPRNRLSQTSVAFGRLSVMRVRYRGRLIPVLRRQVRSAATGSKV